MKLTKQNIKSYSHWKKITEQGLGYKYWNMTILLGILSNLDAKWLENPTRLHSWLFD